MVPAFPRAGRILERGAVMEDPAAVRQENLAGMFLKTGEHVAGRVQPPRWKLRRPGGFIPNGMAGPGPDVADRFSQHAFFRNAG